MLENRPYYVIMYFLITGIEMRVQSPEVHPSYASQVGYYLMRNPQQPQQNPNQPSQTVRIKMVIFDQRN